MRLFSGRWCQLIPHLFFFLFVMWCNFHVLCLGFQSSFVSLTPLHLLSYPRCSCMPACPLLPFSLYFLFSLLVFTILLLSTEGTLYCSSCLSRAQLGLLRLSHLHLWFPICNHPAIMGKGSVDSPLVCSDCTWSFCRAVATSRAVWPLLQVRVGSWPQGRKDTGHIQLCLINSSKNIRDGDWVGTRAMKLWNACILQLFHMQNILFIRNMFSGSSGSMRFSCRGSFICWKSIKSRSHSVHNMS